MQIKLIFRMRILSLMIWVAVLAMVTWSIKATANHYRYKPIRAQRLAKAEVEALFGRVAEQSSSAPTMPELARMHADMIRYHKELEQKYRKGAAEPWVELPPDPPDPLMVQHERLMRESDELKQKSQIALRKASRFLQERRSEGDGNGLTCP